MTPSSPARTTIGHESPATVRLVSALLDRIRSINPRVADGAVAAGLIIGLAAETAAYADHDMGRVATSGVMALALVTLTVRRRRPLIPLVAILVAVVVMAVFEGDFLQRLTVPYLAVMLALYSLGRHFGRGNVFGIGLAAIAVTAAAGMIGNDADGPTQYLWLVILAGAPLLVGRTLRNRRRLQYELRDRTRQLEREGELRADRAVEDERVRIAGELQAVVANGVSAMVVQAEAVPRVIAASETERAADSLQLIEETGRDALAEMRRLLGVLRHNEDARALAPQPTLAEAQGLVERAREIGLEVAVEVEGERLELPVGVDLAAYRVLEETLGSAARDGAASATIVIAYGESEIRLDVRDDRTSHEPEPEPLRRIRERLNLYGGRVRSEPATDGAGHRLVARMPLSGAPA
jgi:signal transduction histidine kinase